MFPVDGNFDAGVVGGMTSVNSLMASVLSQTGLGIALGIMVGATLLYVLYRMLFKGVRD